MRKIFFSCTNKSSHTSSHLTFTSSSLVHQFLRNFSLKLIAFLVKLMSHIEFGSNRIKCCSHGFSLPCPMEFNSCTRMCAYAYELWEKLHAYFQKQKAPQLQAELHATTLENRIVAEYLLCIKATVDLLASIGNPVPLRQQLMSYLRQCI